MSCNLHGCLSRGITYISEDHSKVQVEEGYLKLSTTDWLKKYEEYIEDQNIVEVRFKNTRKEYFRNIHGLSLKKSDIVAVETDKGHDIGTVSLTGRLVINRLKQQSIDPSIYNFKAIYRKAKPEDIKKWEQAIESEHPTLVKSRQIIENLKISMKLSDVEYQGDMTKATFFYIADERVDFRELIKVLAREFQVKIEMRQIGARQEAGRVGGIGSCGRELCCSSWKKEFNTVSLDAVKYQELPLNVQKLAGQCGKLKCCMVYEVDSYLEARKELPKELLNLDTPDGTAFYHKTDVLKRIMYYSYNEDIQEDLIPVTVQRVKEIIGLNKRGIKVNLLTDDSNPINVNKNKAGITYY